MLKIWVSLFFVIHQPLYKEIKLVDTLFIDSLSLYCHVRQERVNVRRNAWRKHQLTSVSLATLRMLLLLIIQH